MKVEPEIMTDPEPTILQKWNQLHEYLGKFDRIGVALSGGVDSALVAAIAAAQRLTGGPAE